MSGTAPLFAQYFKEHPAVSLSKSAALNHDNHADEYRDSPKEDG